MASTSTRLAPALVGLLLPYRGRFALVGVGVLLAAALDVVGPLAIRQLVDENLVPRRLSGVSTIAAVYLTALAAGQIVTAVYTYVAATVAQRALADLRGRLFAHLLALPAAHHDQESTGDGVARTTADVDAMDGLFSSSAAALLGETVRLVSVAIALVTLSPFLTGVAALAIPPVVLLTIHLRRRIRDAERTGRQAVGTVTATLRDHLVGIDVIRAYAREQDFADRFRSKMMQWLNASNRSTRYNSVYAPTLAVLSAATTAILVWWGGHGAADAVGVSIGTLTAFVLLFTKFLAPLINLGDEWQTVQAALAAAERVFGTLGLAIPERPARRASTRRPRSTRPRVELRDVSFGYQADHTVLRNITFNVGAGEHVCVIGRSGAGKTTMVALVAGLYRPAAGHVRLAGHEPTRLSDLDRQSLLGFVPQTPQLFAGTIYQNLTWADPGIDPNDVARAIRTIGADSLVAALPEGVHTRIDGGGHGDGIRLSDGQRQLIALGRALIRRPPVLLLDEATSTVDAATDAAFRSALREESQTHGTAVLTITHRLSTARDADRVLVLANGTLVEQGSPTELAATGGHFSALKALEDSRWSTDDSR